MSQEPFDPTHARTIGSQASPPASPRFTPTGDDAHRRRARLRYTLNRDRDAYHDIYPQRTATERVNSQACALGIERPRLRNGRAIANQNTLIYVLINLRALHRVRRKKRHQVK